MIDKDLKVIARANVNTNQTFALPPRDALAHITDKDPQIVLLPDANYVAAIIKLEQYDDTYLYVTRLLDPRVVPQLQATRASVTEYAALESASPRCAGRIRFDVHRHRADRASLGGLDRI